MEVCAVRGAVETSTKDQIPLRNERRRSKQSGFVIPRSPRSFDTSGRVASFTASQSGRSSPWDSCQINSRRRQRRLASDPGEASFEDAHPIPRVTVSTRARLTTLPISLMKMMADSFSAFRPCRPAMRGSICPDPHEDPGQRAHDRAPAHEVPPHRRRTPASVGGQRRRTGARLPTNQWIAGRPRFPTLRTVSVLEAGRQHPTRGMSRLAQVPPPPSPRMAIRASMMLARSPRAQVPTITGTTRAANRAPPCAIRRSVAVVAP